MAAPLLLNPQVAAAGIGAIGSLGGTLLNGVLNRQSIASQIAASKELMDYQWQKFQSPMAQVKSMASAGINPAVALGQGGSGFTATPSAAMPSSVPPQISGIMDIANFVKAMAEAKNAGLDSVSKEMENELNRQTLDERIKAVGLQNKFTEEQITKVIQEWNKTIGEINILQKDADIKQIDLEKHKDLVNSIINHYVSQKNLNDEQVKNIREQLPDILAKLKAEAKILNVDADIAETFKGTMSGLGVVGDVVKILMNVVKMFK